MGRKTRLVSAVTGCLLPALWAAVPAGATTIPKGDVTIDLETVASGLTAPVGVTHAADGSGRLFIVEQSGQIRIVDNGVLLPDPFLDISDKLPALNAFFDERGLLGLAFHPDYADNGRFFVRHSVPREGAPDEPCSDPGNFIAGCHSEVLAEYQVSAGDPNVADPTSEIILFSVDEPQFNHNAGEVAFGPDGLLYFTLGDGGGADDGLSDDPPSHGPIGHGQNIETVLGSVLRIDVDSAPQAPLAYAIPPDNPFVGVPGADEIYAYGMRNPFKFSFDDGPGGDGSLYVADVGQDLFEEVSIVVNGGNYGWVIREGFHCFDPQNPVTPPDVCPDTGGLGEPLLDPIVEYAHPGTGFEPEGGITVIGGFVYRGTRSPALFGTYVFGDFAQQFTLPSGSLYLLTEPNPGTPEIRQFRIGPDDVPYGLFLKGFGEDEEGEIYACGTTALAPFGDSGVVQRIVARPDASLDIKPGGCPNPLNRNSNGVLPVALLGSSGFDVSQVDLSSVRLSRADAGQFFSATLSGDQEVPPVATPAGGSATLNLSADLGALNYTITLSGVDLDGQQTPGDPSDDVVGMHFHNAAAGSNGPVIFGIINPAHDLDDRVIDAAAGTVSGTWEDTDPANGTLSDFIDELQAGEMYINVHTPAHPSGEIRGQILGDPDAGTVAPLAGPPGPHSAFDDVGTAFAGDLCDCHDLEGDGFTDLLMKFKVQELVAALGLQDVPGGSTVALTVSGALIGGASFSASDCVLIVPPGSIAPANTSVQSNVNDLFIEILQPDLNGDGDGFATFGRAYAPGSLVTVTAPPGSNHRPFVKWLVDNVPLPAGQRTASVIAGDEVILKALYRRPPDWTATPQGAPAGI